MKNLSDYHRNRRIEKQLKIAGVLVLVLMVIYLFAQAVKSGY